MKKYKILYEDKDLFVLYKSYGLAVQSARPSVPDALGMLRNDLMLRGDKNIELFPVNRLDQPVEGIFLVARNSKSAGELSRQVSDHSHMEKIYQALVYGRPLEKEGRLIDYLVKDNGHNVSCVVPAGTQNAKRSELLYHMVRTWQDKSLLEIRILTGRHHQIRVQLAHAGMPIVGDTKYGKAESGFHQLSLCSCKLSFRHPRTGEPLSFQVEPTFPVPPTAL